jgi:hypothetical protein
MHIKAIIHNSIAMFFQKNLTPALVIGLCLFGKSFSSITSGPGRRALQDVAAFPVGQRHHPDAKVERETKITWTIQAPGLPDFFLSQNTKTGKNVPKNIKYTKWPQNVPKGHKIYQMATKYA